MKRRAVLLSFVLLAGAFAGFLQIGCMRAKGTDVSGQIDTDTTWDLAGSPYNVVGDIIVGATLTIEPGVKVIFSGNYWIDVWGTLISVGTAAKWITIDGIDFVYFGGISINSMGDIDIKYTRILHTQYGLIIESSNNVISNNYFLRNFETGISISSSNNIIANNTILSGFMTSAPTYEIGILVGGRYNVIENNTISGNEGSNIYIYGRYNKIINNIVEYGYWCGINITSSGNTIKNNYIYESQVDGIKISSSYNNKVIGNDITHTLMGKAVSLISSSFNKIENNNIIFSGGALWEPSTIYLYSSSNNEIIGNIIADNQEGGIYLDTSFYNTISGNEIDSNSWLSGVSLLSSSNNIITDNNVSNNSPDGIHLESSSNNRIYHNNLISNTIQAFDDRDDNFWNDTYPSGGNYWSDYSPTCQDLYDGAVTPQTTGVPDGMCDFQYDIDSDSADYYPLTQPGPPPPPLEPPTGFMAELTGNHLENVTISWDASSDDPIRATKYAVYYNTNYDSHGLNYEFLTDIPATGASKYSLTIPGIGEGNPNSYFFYVKTNGTGTFGKSDTQVAKSTNFLMTGEHLISIPLILNDTNISNALQTLEFDVVWSYDSTDLLDPWKSYNPLKTFNDLTFINHTMALWVNVTEKSNLTIAGIVPKTTNILLESGWNFVGYPSFVERSVSEALSGIVYERIEGYDNAPPHYLRLYTDTDKLKPGLGFWIKVQFDQVWTITND